MRTLGATLALVLVTSTIVPLAGLSVAQPPGEDGNDPACDPGAIVDNEDLRIWFHGKKGQLQVFKKNDSGDGIDGMYQYKQLAIREVDEDDQTVATLVLEDAEPMDSSCEVERSGEWTNVTYTVTDEVRTAADDGPETDTADVTFVYHFNENSSDAKFDLLVEGWAWEDDDGHELAYDFEATSGEWDIETAENGLGFRDNETGESEAFIEWAPNATARYDDGHEEQANVTSSTTGDQDHVEVTLRFTDVTAGYVELDYDPTVAVGPYLIVADILVPATIVPEPVQGVADHLG